MQHRDLDRIFEELRSHVPMWPCSKCGKMHNRTRGRSGKPASYCNECHAAYMREHRPRHSELTPEQRAKSNARAYANEYLRRGRLQRQPCADCGWPVAEMHHDDYSKPLDVTWLCRRCHLARHRRAADAERRARSARFRRRRRRTL